MPSYLRSLKKNHWDKERNWLIQTNNTENVLARLQADIFLDLKPSGNALSVWEVAEGESNLPRIASAFISTRDDKDWLDYVLLPDGLLESLQVRKEKSPGDSCDKEVNELFHYDLLELSAQKLISMAAMIGNMEVRRINPQKGLELLDTAISSGFIAEDKLKEGLQKGLAKFRSKRN